MKNKFLNFPVFFLVLLVAGCSGIADSGKVFWGSSTRALEKARPQAVRAVLGCPAQDCYQTALDVVEHKAKMDEALLEKKVIPSPEPVTAVRSRETTDLALLSGLQVFIKNPRKKLIVIMGLPDSVDTTEVGLFFSAASEGTTLIEISSLSQRAKARAAELILPEIQKTCPLVVESPAGSTAPPSQP